METRRVRDTERMCYRYNTGVAPDTLPDRSQSKMVLFVWWDDSERQLFWNRCGSHWEEETVISMEYYTINTVRIIIKFPPNARTHGYRYGHLPNAWMGVHRCTNECPRQTGTGVRQILKRASDRTSTERATIRGSCWKCWRIPANDINVIPANDT